MPVPGHTPRSTAAAHQPRAEFPTPGREQRHARAVTPLPAANVGVMRAIWPGMIQFWVVPLPAPLPVAARAGTVSTATASIAEAEGRLDRDLI